MIEDTSIKLTTSYLVFKLGKHKFAINVSEVVEILELPEMTDMLNAPELLKGVFNLRGRIIPVVDTHIKFNLPAIKYDENTCVLVLRVVVNDEVLVMGALTDSVEEVIELTPDQIEHKPSLGAIYNPEFITGTYQANDDIIAILDLGKSLSSNDQLLIQDAVKAA